MRESFQSSLYLNQEKSGRLINMTSMFQCTPESKLKDILLIHAMWGCDTTSGLFSIGKTKLFKSTILEDDPALTSVFYKSDSSQADVITAGEKIILKLYGKNKVNSLDELRYVSYKKRLHSNTKKKKVDHRKLPPSSAAARFHNLRVYHQVQEWNKNDLPPVEFGWCEIEERLEQLTL